MSGCVVFNGVPVRRLSRPSAQEPFSMKSAQRRVFEKSGCCLSFSSPYIVFQAGEAGVINSKVLVHC